ncbi:MAG: GNAT family N-acetyltransferase [Bryobacteraceae bacterium]
MRDHEVVNIGRRDSSQALQLSMDARWNQTAADWQRVCELEPEGCFGIRCDGRLVATASSLRYGSELGWIGMVLTDRAYRGRGFARALMNHCLEFLERRVRLIRLDATDMGKPLYASLGFRDNYLLERWIRPPAPSAKPIDLDSFQPQPELDRAAFGADRSRLLQTLSRIESVSSSGLGYAMGRPGSLAAYFGPCVSTQPQTARSFLLWYLARHSHEAVCWDLIPKNVEAVKLALEFGFKKCRTLTRMQRPGCEPIPGEDLERPGDVYALAGFEFG